MFDRTFMVCTRALAPNMLCPCPLCRRDAEIERLQRENTNLRNTVAVERTRGNTEVARADENMRRGQAHALRADRLAADVKACEELLQAAQAACRSAGREIARLVHDKRAADLRGENKTLRDAMARDQETIAELRAEIASLGATVGHQAEIIRGLQADAKAHVAAAEAGGREIARLTAGCRTLRRERDHMQGERDAARTRLDAARKARHPAACVFDVPGACRSMADAMNAACIAELDKVQYLKDIRDRVGDRGARLATVDWFPNGEPKIVFALRVAEAR